MNLNWYKIGAGVVCNIAVVLGVTRLFGFPINGRAYFAIGVAVILASLLDVFVSAIP